MNERAARVLWWCELAAALLLTAVAIALHVRLLTHLGPLWRDEISSWRLATLDNAHDFWTCSASETFPLLFLALLRGWIALGLGASDFQLRCLGLGIGLLIVAAVWISARWTNRRSPLWPLALLALTPITIQVADQLRPHGFAVLWLILFFGATYRLTFDEPQSRRAFVASIIFALLAVQSAYTAAFLVFAICLGAISISLANRNLPRAFAILLVGAIAATSILPYAHGFSAGHRWLGLLPGHGSVRDIIYLLYITLALGSAWSVIAWIAIPIAGVAAATHGESRLRVAFAAIVLVSATVVVFSFFRLLHWQTHHRYLFPLVAVGAMCLHVFAEPLQRRVSLRIANLVAAIAFAALQIPTSWADATFRLTNADLAAVAVAERATTDDLVVLTTFYHGVSFARYYHGAASWTALPPLADYRWYRWDLAMDEMSQTDPIATVRMRIEDTLRAGHRVFLVGAIANRPSADMPSSLPPAPTLPSGWELQPYLANWQAQIGSLIEQHAINGNAIEIDPGQPVYEVDTVGVFILAGWRDVAR